jgi:hypothetical protein
MSDLAIALALGGDSENLSQSRTLCERVLSNSQSEKARHTTRAALCFIYMKAGEQEKAIAMARKLPHVRESQETVIAQFEKGPAIDDINSYLRFIAIGESDEQDLIEIDFGTEMAAVYSEHDLRSKIKGLRDEYDAPQTREGMRKIPQIRIRDKTELASRQVRVRYYADYLLDKTYDNPAGAADEIMMALRKIAQTNITINSR